MSQRSNRRRSVTIEDVAQAAGVSRAAVSKVIRNASGVSTAMRVRVNAAIQELDYRPSVAARAMRGASYTLGIETPPPGNQFFTQIVNGAGQALDGTPYQLVMAPANGGREYGAIEALADRQVDGMVVVSPLVEPAWLERLAETLPVVMLGRHGAASHYDAVVGDDVQGTRAVMAHLLELGHRRIAHLTEREAVTEPGSGSPHSLRLLTYRESMAAAGLDRFAQVVRTGQTEADARLATLALLAGPDRPTAVFAGHDQLAVGALAAITELGLPPGEVSLVGYDNIDLAGHPAISLTTVDQSGTEMGRQAITMLLERIAGRTEPRRHTITPVLHVRRSTAPRAAA
ncbi:LacI family DNA-binding transcriptional regulator [Streptomyces odontomachi]|uniref:LacI family DNA-binding transcriptional regulator n=1 Tax=Streptomyces odontomachi TaxID=2944940 RepID=UPI002109F6AF|nr:LacI family DNA-binding transcriptional regulator [Streptomyces sp. ODS25]